MKAFCNLEKPVPWLESVLDGERNQLMYDALRFALDKYQLRYREVPIRFRTEFVLRKAPYNGFCISYHSVGNSRHVWRVKETPVPYFYSFDRLGFSAWSEISQFPERFFAAIDAVPFFEAKLFVESLSQYLRKNNLSKYAQNEETSLNLPDDFIFFPLQVRNDIVFQFCHIDPLKVVRFLASRAKKNGQFLIIKRHPLCKSKRVTVLLSWLIKTNPFVIVSGASINQLIPKCSKVVVANSGVGFEALIHQKQVLSFAKSEYSIASNNFTSLKDLEQMLQIENYNNVFAIKYVFYFLNKLCFDARDPAAIERFLNLVLFCLENDFWCEKKLIDCYRDSL